MKIIKQGKINNDIRCTCGKCDCEFEYEQSDIFLDKQIGFCIKCPTCGSFIGAIKYKKAEQK